MTPRERLAAGLTDVVGWIILAAALSKVSLLVVPFMLMSAAGKAAAMLTLLGVPPLLLALAGAIGLLRRRFWGYYVIYALTVVSLIGMRVSFLSGVPLIPFLDRALSGPLQPYFNLVANLALTLALLWAHYQLSPEGTWWKRGRNLWAVAAGAAVVLALTAWVNRFHYVNRPVASAAEVPVVGAQLADFKARGAVDVCVMETFLPLHGVMGIFGGTADRAEVEALARRFNLAAIDREEGWRKMLPLLRTWRLDEARFPREFGADALHYIGRVPGERKLLLQLCWRPADGRFVALVMGLVAPPARP